MCDLFDVSRSGYYDWLKRKPSTRALEYRTLDRKISRIYFEHNGNYGHRRIAYELKDMGFRVSKERVRRRMHKLGIKGIQRKKFKYTTDSNHNLPVAPNLLMQNFSTTNPDQTWVCDITYVRVKQRWLYLAVVLDLYSRKIIGWAMSNRINAALVCDALRMGLSTRSYPKGVMVHSDRGSQYCSAKYQELLKAYKLVCSMSGKGNCYDNAVCESFFHTLKVEQVYRQTYQTVEEARASIFWYIEAYYNLKRKHSALGYKTPAQFEKLAA